MGTFQLLVLAIIVTPAKMIRPIAMLNSTMVPALPVSNVSQYSHPETESARQHRVRIVPKRNEMVKRM